jgi:uncharacterized lipoprotein YajG
MKLALILAALAMCTGCATRLGEHRTAPSVAAVRANISEAQASSRRTTAEIQSIRQGATAIDYKASRALEFFE